jgi:hypothetical protein
VAGFVSVVAWLPTRFDSPVGQLRGAGERSVGVSRGINPGAESKKAAEAG